ncbi:hypothetical protein GCM10023083_48200 [Streptomyces phyllanthi]
MTLHTAATRTGSMTAPQGTSNDAHVVDDVDNADDDEVDGAEEESFAGSVNLCEPWLPRRSEQ